MVTRRFGKKIEFIIKHVYTLYKLKISLLMNCASWKSLKKYSKFAKHDNDHLFYEEAIKKVCAISSLPKIVRSEFVGKGRGENVLNSYRKVMLEDGHECFEKVYKNKSDDLLKTMYFYNNAYSSIVKDFVVPSFFVVEGKHGTIIYFDWIDMRSSVPKNKLLTFYNDFRESALDVETNHSVCSSLMSDFAREPSYIYSFKKAKKWLSSNRLGKDRMLQKIESHLKSLKLDERVFTHGDIVPANCADKNVIIDFDRCGVYPMGYELAYLLSRSFYFSCLFDLNAKIKSYIVELSENNKLGFYFFAFLFYAARKNIQASDSFLYELWKKTELKANELEIK